MSGESREDTSGGDTIPDLASYLPWPCSQEMTFFWPFLPTGSQGLEKSLPSSLLIQPTHISCLASPSPTTAYWGVHIYTLIPKLVVGMLKGQKWV